MGSLTKLDAELDALDRSSDQQVGLASETKQNKMN